MYGRSFSRDWHTRVKSVHLFFLHLVGMDLHQGQFHDPVDSNIEAGGFNIKEYEGFGQLKPHQAVIFGGRLQK